MNAYLKRSCNGGGNPVAIAGLKSSPKSKSFVDNTRPSIKVYLNIQFAYITHYLEVLTEQTYGNTSHSICLKRILWNSDKKTTGFMLVGKVIKRFQHTNKS